MTTGHSRRDFLKLAAGTAAGWTAARASAGAQPATRPRNVVFILTDDQRYDALGMLNPFFETPALDALAKNGVLFERAFVTCSLCSPSRATVLTGQYAHRHGVLDNQTALPADTPVFPCELQKAGYRTGYIGKWHMGGDSDAPQPGFDRWVSFKGQGVYQDPVFNVDGARTPQQGYVSELITDHAESFLRASKDAPFFLYVAHKAVHAEFLPPEAYRGTYANRTYPCPASMENTDENYAGKPAWVRAQRGSWHGVDGMYDGKTDFQTFTRAYAETLRGVDDSVARIVSVLKELGLLESTLIVFTSDNGFQFGEHGLIDKRTMYEASIRVPLIVHCPELTPPGQRREMVLNVDFAPTILEAAGVAAPDSIQGKSFYPLLTGAASSWRTDWLYEYFWERSFPQTPTVLGVRTDRYKLMRYHGIWDRYELYDLEHDPEEMNNLLADFAVTSQGGTLDALIDRSASEETKATFTDLAGRLKRLLEETGAAHEPVWRHNQGQGG